MKTWFKVFGFLFIIVVISSAFVMFVFACNSKAEPSPAPPDPNAMYIDSAVSVHGGQLQVLIDPKRNNVCYYVTSYGYGETAPGISCLPNH